MPCTRNCRDVTELTQCRALLTVRGNNVTNPVKHERK